jgi:hypothetical protein
VESCGSGEEQAWRRGGQIRPVDHSVPSSFATTSSHATYPSTALLASSSALRELHGFPREAFKALTAAMGVVIENPYEPLRTDTANLR